MPSILLSLLILIASMPAIAAGKRPASLREFRATCRTNMDARDFNLLAAPKVGETIYVSIQNLVAGQVRFSYQRMLKQLDEIVGKNGRDTLPYNHGRSAFPKRKARGGIYYRGKVYLFDRHHHTLANIYLGGQTMPVSIRGNWSKLTPEQFEARLLRTHLRYPYGTDGRAQAIPDLCELIEDPYLFLPELFMATVRTTGDNHKVESVKGSDPAVLIKVDEGVPYTELEAVEPLIRAQFPLPDLSKPLSKDVLNEISDLIEEAIDAGYSRLSENTLLEKASRIKDLDLQKIVDEYYSQRRPCGAYLRTPQETK